MRTLSRVRARGRCSSSAMAAASSGCSYNRFVTQEEAVKAQWAQVENQLQRRNDLIPNLVESTKGFAQQERDVFKAIADSRAQAGRRADDRAEDSGRQRAVVGPGPAARRRRELPAAALERDVRAPDGRAGRHREPHCRRAHALQRAGAGVQHAPGGRSRPTSPPASSASRNTRCSRRRNRPRSRRRSTSAGRRPRQRTLTAPPVGRARSSSDQLPVPRAALAGRLPTAQLATGPLTLSNPSTWLLSHPIKCRWTMSPLRLKGIRALSSAFTRPIWVGCTTSPAGWRARNRPTS